MNSQKQHLKKQLAHCRIADQFRFKRRLDRLSGSADSSTLDKLEQDLAASCQWVQQRSEWLAEAHISYPDLPVSERRDEIAEAIQRHQVVVIAGETGSGKTTQLPKICLQLGLGEKGVVGHTQPRRIAARSVASRIAEELGTELGDRVGYKVRFHDRVSEASFIKVMTDGILLSEITRDRFLNQYEVLIIDEAHERSLNIDFILGYLKQLLPFRPDLKLIITSATIDPERFSKHFGGAPIINVSGRTYPVEVRYRPPEDEIGNERDLPMQQSIVDAVDEIGRDGRGDILVFLSGEREIRETAETLRKHKLQLTEILPLYARLGSKEQARIFRTGGQRRIILSTNVAETSLTVPGIRYVIDTGFARISRYSHRSKIQRLPVERISQASAQQRSGRCGRVAAGICIRLYTEEDFSARPEFTEPEILRTNLASVILQMKLVGFGDIERFQFVDQPDNRMIRDGYRVLQEIGAVDNDKRITSIGRSIARLPVDPRIGRMLLTAAHSHCLAEVLIIAAALAVQDPRERPLDKQQAADEFHRQFHDEQSDFIAFIKLWQHLEEQRKHLSRRKFQAYCRDHYLSWNRVQEWHDVQHQLRGQLHEMGYRENQEEAGYELIHKAILSGMLSNIGFKSTAKGHEYLGARNTHFHVFPGSGLFRRQPKWLVAAEIVETSKLYARLNATVKPEWIESVSGHLVKRSYSAPHWEKRRGQVAAYEKVQLFGLPIVAKRKVNYGPLNPVESREIFVRSALVERDFDTRAPFWRHNLQLLDDIGVIEQKTRRRDILVDDQTLYDFYDQRIPAGIYSRPGFEKWLRQETQARPKLLHMRRADLVRSEEAKDFPERYPDDLTIGQVRLPLRYHFEPGDRMDGVILEVPNSVLNQVTEARCQWLVPGLLRERVIALLKSLPKNLRRSFVPVPDYADGFIAAVKPSDRPLVQVLAEYLKQKTGVYIPEDAWHEGQLPDYLKMCFKVLDNTGKTIATSRNLAELKQGYGGDDEHDYHRFQHSTLERDSITDWDFGELPKHLEVREGGIDLIGYPALVDRYDSVSIQVLDAEENANIAHRAGVRRLIMLQQAKDMRYLRRNLKDIERLQLLYAKAPLDEVEKTGIKPPSLQDELVSRIVDLTYLEGRPEIRDAAGFSQRIDTERGALMGIANELMVLVSDVLRLYQPLRKQLHAARQLNWVESVSDMKQQLDQLVFRGCFTSVPYDCLQSYPRYLKALSARLEKLQHALARDRQNLHQLQPLYLQWQERYLNGKKQKQHDPRLEEIRWMFEELRVSLFAQELKTAYPVSLKRIQKRWQELGL